jgi:hypothetical protein
MKNYEYYTNQRSNENLIHEDYIFNRHEVADEEFWRCSDKNVPREAR